MAELEIPATPLAEALARVGDRWTLLVVEALLAGPLRFNDLAEQIPGIAASMLSERLKRLERDALIVAAKPQPKAAAKAAGKSAEGARGDAARH